MKKENKFYDEKWEVIDLKKDYWTIVGFDTEEHFKQGAQVKLQLLKNIGFTLDSNLLDIGCGSGIIPSVIYEGMTGKYYGCDIGARAIEFCKQKYTKDNFVFFVNGQTNVEINDGIKFDFIVLYSVFTHCYTDEIVAIINQIKPYLKQGGKIMADFFVGQFDGDDRYISAMPQAKFDEIIAGSGLKCTVISNNKLPKRYAESSDIDRILITLE